jgi:hypothetical protein
VIEKVEHAGKTYALILRSNYEEQGVNFITPQDNPFQLGILKHVQGVKIKPHVHRNLPRNIVGVQEILHIEYGEVEAKFYDDAGNDFQSVILGTGDTVLLLAGGHGFNILKDAKILEVKQGPYYGADDDKQRFNTK